MSDGTHFGVWGGTAERLRRTLRRTGRVVLAHGDVATYDRATGDVVIVTAGPVPSAADAREALIAHTLGERPEVLAAVAS